MTLSGTSTSFQPTERGPRVDRYFAGLLRLAALTSGSIVLLIIGFLVIESLPVLNAYNLKAFLVNADWHPISDPPAFGSAPLIAATLLAAAGAVMLAVPLGLASAIFTRFYATGPLGGFYRRVIELLAGVPSVVYGLWGLVVLVPLIGQWSPPGQSLLAGILILTLMILPTIALMSDAALAAVPDELQQGAEALGLGRWATVCGVMLPAARSGIQTGILLAAGRAIGETMAVLMVCGNIVQLPDSVFDPVRTLTANIALEMAYALDLHRSALFVSGLILSVFVMTLVLMAHSPRRTLRNA